MTIGNTAAMTVNAAAMSPPDLSKTTCEELDDKNQDERSKSVAGLQAAPQTGDVKDSLEKAQGAGMTFSSAKVSVNIGNGQSISGVASGCSNAKARECNPGGLVDGGTSAAKNGGEPVLCPEADYTHPKGGAGAHAEAKIFNEMSEMAKQSGGTLQGGSVVLNIDWRYKAADKQVYGSGMPCRLCYRMMCAATKCGIQIHICDSKNEPQPFNPDDDCDKESDDPKDDPYQRLDGRLKEDPKLGVGQVNW